MIPTTSDRDLYVNSSQGRDATLLDASTITLLLQHLKSTIYLHKKHQLLEIVKIKKMKFAGSTKEIYVDMMKTNADINTPATIDYKPP